MERSATPTSGSLPPGFPATEIDGEFYWDGGYSGNPSIAPLIRECSSRDTILVQINPIERPGTPRTAREIHNRLNEIAFNSALIKELRGLGVGIHLIPDGDVAGNMMRILERDYGANARIVGVADGSGVGEDPQGLDHGAGTVRPGEHPAVGLLHQLQAMGIEPGHRITAGISSSSSSCATRSARAWAT